MQIKILNDGGTHVSVVNPATGEEISTTEVPLDSQVTVTLPSVHDAEGIEVGSVEPQGEPASAPPEDEDVSDGNAGGDAEGSEDEADAAKQAAPPAGSEGEGEKADPAEGGETSG